MPLSKSSLITLKKIDETRVLHLFSQSIELKKNFNEHRLSSGPYHSGYKGTAALLFFEPSTRTRFSFEAASSRAGYHPMILDGGIGTSIEKGETIEDTISNIQALHPSFFVIRCQDQVNLEQIDEALEVPVINAGWGKRGHPTQALLDGLTMYERLGNLAARNVLFVGDIKHSRVVASHRELSEVMRYNMGFCAPHEFLPEVVSAGIQSFSSLKEALEWADVVIALRVQKERHENENLFLIEDYRENFGINSERLALAKPEVMIMHPGPINYGVEIESEILHDPRCAILKQVENGAFLREALIRNILDNEKES